MTTILIMGVIESVLGCCGTRENSSIVIFPSLLMSTDSKSILWTEGGELGDGSNLGILDIHPDIKNRVNNNIIFIFISFLME